MTTREEKIRQRAEALAAEEFPDPASYYLYDWGHTIAISHREGFLAGFLARDADEENLHSIRRSPNFSVWRDRRDRGSYQWVWGAFEYHPDEGGRRTKTTPEEAIRLYGPITLSDTQPKEAGS